MSLLSLVTKPQATGKDSLKPPRRPSTPTLLPQDAVISNFEYTKEASLHNSAIIAQYNYDLKKAILAQDFSHFSTGLELCPSIQLQPLLRHHPNFTTLKQIVDLGVNYPIKSLPEETRIINPEAQLEKRNAK